MRRRSYTPQIQAEVLRNLELDREVHVIFEPDWYRDDGKILIGLDNTSTFLHRHLYRLLVDPDLKRKTYLRPTCKFGWQCVNPHHYVKGRRRMERCRNGHELTPENTFPEGKRLACMTCAENARVKRSSSNLSRANQNKLKTHCPHGHEYTPENTYRHTNEKGHVSRSCKTCTIARTRAAQRVERERRNERATHRKNYRTADQAPAHPRPTGSDRAEAGTLLRPPAGGSR